MAAVAPDPPLVAVSFNAEGTHLVAATSSGIRVFSCIPRLEHVFSSRSGFADDVTGADLALGLSEPMQVAVVFGHTIRYWSQSRGEMVVGADMKPSAIGSAVRAIRHVGDHVAVARYSRVTLHEMSKEHGGAAKLIMEVDTAPNPLGACALALVDDDGAGGGQGFVLACPSPTIRETQIWRKGWGAPLHVRAHDSSVRGVELSPDGHLLATADSMGMYVLISSTADGLVRCRIIVSYAATTVIHCMAFSHDSKWLLVCNNQGAMHVYPIKVNLSPLTPDELHDDDEPADGADAAYMPPHARACFLANARSIRGPAGRFRLQEGVRYQVAFGQEPNTILIIGIDGNFYLCQFDPVKARVKQIEHRNVMTEFK